MSGSDCCRPGSMYLKKKIKQRVHELINNHISLEWMSGRQILIYLVQSREGITDREFTTPESILSRWHINGIGIEKGAHCLVPIQNRHVPFCPSNMDLCVSTTCANTQSATDYLFCCAHAGLSSLSKHTFVWPIPTVLFKIYLQRSALLAILLYSRIIFFRTAK